MRTSGSTIAKRGFINEKSVEEKFKNWKTDPDGKQWIKSMNYSTTDVIDVKTKLRYKSKADLQIDIITDKKTDIHNIQIKLVSIKTGFNQIDKHKVDVYTGLWKIPENISNLLKYFTGELIPYIDTPKDHRRMFITEFTKNEQAALIKFINDNKFMIISDIMKGRGSKAAEWLLVVNKLDETTRSIIRPMNEVINQLNGDTIITPRGSIKIGKITMQRKGGDSGKDSAKMLQFKIDPNSLFNNNDNQ